MEQGSACGVKRRAELDHGLTKATARSRALLHRPRFVLNACARIAFSSAVRAVTTLR
jgi:hypothetical protein